MNMEITFEQAVLGYIFIVVLSYLIYVAVTWVMSFNISRITNELEQIQAEIKEYYKNRKKMALASFFGVVIFGLYFMLRPLIEEGVNFYDSISVSSGLLGGWLLTWFLSDVVKFFEVSSEAIKRIKEKKKRANQ